jgi:hypothetical protein
MTKEDDVRKVLTAERGANATGHRKVSVLAPDTRWDGFRATPRLDTA